MATLGNSKSELRKRRHRFDDGARFDESVVERGRHPSGGAVKLTRISLASRGKRGEGRRAKGGVAVAGVVGAGVVRHGESEPNLAVTSRLPVCYLLSNFGMLV